MEQYIEQLQQELCTLTIQAPHSSHDNSDHSNSSHDSLGDIQYKIQWCQDNDDLLSLHHASSLESLPTTEVPLKRVGYGGGKSQRDTLLSLRRTLALMQYVTLGLVRITVLV